MAISLIVYLSRPGKFRKPETFFTFKLSDPVHVHPVKNVQSQHIRRL
jgi:hypothetical protein